MNEHDYEPVPGLPAPLPMNETILWQGAPDWRVLARRGMRVRLMALYFALLIVWGIAGGMADGKPMMAIARSSAWLALLAAVALALLTLFAWLVARTTLYTITSRRVVMRYGIALPITIQIPFTKIDGAGLREWTGGGGDIALSLPRGERIAYFVLWPHARPWSLAHARPSFRSIPEAATAAQVLGRALAAHASQPARVIAARADADRGEDAPVAAAA